MMYKLINFIRNKIDKRTLLEQLAEECAELSKASNELGQATLKMIRADRLSNNMTPKNHNEVVGDFLQARLDIIEEFNDVFLVIDVLENNNQLNIERYKKLKRWAERLGYKEGY